jgi:phosphatidylserine/phosphatidylglycerophosphate/cardiolipin synthase-like enzyme
LDQFSYWEKELAKLGHAVNHDKIMVIDPFRDNCVVVTGSHNLGDKASYSNDENLCILRGNRATARDTWPRG